MKGQDIEPDMGAILYWYIKGNGGRKFHDNPHIQMELSYKDKSQVHIRWDNMIQGRIDIHCNQCKTSYLKVVTSKERR